jgi:OmpA-OmpF porin, OOP family
MKKLGFVFLILFSLFAKAQNALGPNLVLNPSFEDTSQCPQTFAQFHYVNLWNNPSQNTPDLFSTCSPQIQNGIHVPNNGMGFQLARTGQNYCGVFTFYQGLSEREYIEGILFDTLIKDNVYYFSFYVSLSARSSIAVSNFGIKFLDTLYYENTIYQLSPTPDFESDFVIRDTTRWIEISGKFTAHGGEKHFIIGIFRPDSTLDYDTLNINPFGYFSYYYIDDVSVQLLTDTTPTDPIPYYPAINLFPNPSTDGHFTLEYTFEQAGELILYDMLGQVIEKRFLPLGSHQWPLSFPNTAAGVYFYRVLENGEERKTGRLIVGG